MALICCCIISCKKFVSVPPGGGVTSTETVFGTDSIAMQAVTGIYIQAMNSNSTLLNGLGAYLGLSADELWITTIANPNENQFYLNALIPSNTIVYNNIWKSGYANIYHINACIEQLANSNSITDTLRVRLAAESKFMRALTYFYLVNLFGKVPLVTGTSMDVNSTISRSPETSVNDSIVSDLQDAYSHLPDANDNTRPTRLAAAALLARVYCYLGQWSLAESYSNMVINDGRFQLVLSLNNVFLSGSTETIFQLSPVLSNNSTSEGLSFIPASSVVIPKFVLSSSLINAFESGDMRKVAWVKTNIVRGTSYPFPNKYKIRVSNNPPTEYNIVLRLAEQYLIHAESKANGAGKDLVAATADLNIIRNRAGLPSLGVPGTLEECQQAIAQERRIELFAEWGHRWLDLKRTGKIDSVLIPISAIKGGTWSTYWQWFPIPLSEIQLDPFLTQNTGY